MQRHRSRTDRRRVSSVRVFLAINLAALMLVAIWFRCRALGNIPGTNGDEAWYGVKAMGFLRGNGLTLQTPTCNPINPFFFGPIILLHACFPPSTTLLRLVALAGGTLALALNWWLCGRVFDRPTAIISTVILAVLPIDIAYSRFAWDASESLAATLPVLYFSLATVRFDRHRDGYLAAAIIALIVAVWVHPTNILAGAAIAAAVATRLRWRELL